MKRSSVLALKDLRLLVRDRSALFWVLVFPLMMAVIFGSVFGGSNGPTKIDVAVIDQDRTALSAKLLTKLKSSVSLNVLAPQSEAGVDALESAKDEVRKGKLAAYLLIPKGFEAEVRTFQYSTGPGLRIGIDPTRRAEAGMLQGILSKESFSLIGDQMKDASQGGGLADNLSRIQSSPLSGDEKSALAKLLKDYGSFSKTQSGAGVGAGAAFQGPQIVSDPITSTGTTPASSFEVTFPQALIWGLLGVISSFAISMVKEREQGTLMRLQTSMSMMEILMGKALACLIAALGMMVALLTVGHLVFGIRLASPLLLAMALISGSFCIVGIMMLLSVLGRTEQAVSGSSWGIMITMSMFGGGMIPIFMMPGWMQTASNASPLKWTVLSVEGAIWRGFTVTEMLTPCLILVAIGAVCFGLGVNVLRSRI